MYSSQRRLITVWISNFEDEEISVLGSAMERTFKEAVKNVVYNLYLRYTLRGLSFEEIKRRLDGCEFYYSKEEYEKRNNVLEKGVDSV